MTQQLQATPTHPPSPYHQIHLSLPPTQRHHVTLSLRQCHRHQHQPPPVTRLLHHRHHRTATACLIKIMIKFKIKFDIIFVKLKLKSFRIQENPSDAASSDGQQELRQCLEEAFPSASAALLQSIAHDASASGYHEPPLLLPSSVNARNPDPSAPVTPQDSSSLFACVHYV